MTMQNICVYCGSGTGRNPVYVQHAKLLAELFVQQDIGLVYGGAHIGIMGALADQMLTLGGRVTGVIPERLMIKEIAHQGLTALHVTRSMHERKALMAQLADGFIALPGGIGTLDEIFEIWTWAQLGFHQKPCGLLNVAGYFDHLLAFLDHAASEDLLKSAHRSLLLVEQSPKALLTRMTGYTSKHGLQATLLDFAEL